MNHFTCLGVYGIKHTPDHFRTITYLKHEYFGAMPSLFRDVMQLRWQFLPMFRNSLPVQASRVSHSSWTERPGWVALNVGIQVRI
jgi:hypothetical protein